jgi:hypothetical protein
VVQNPKQPVVNLRLEFGEVVQDRAHDAGTTMAGLDPDRLEMPLIGWPAVDS